MNYKLSAATFVKNSTLGFCLFESMASWLPLVEEFVVLDMGSTDKVTVETLSYLAMENPKIKFYQERFTRDDASAFADAANRCVELCSNDNVLFYQADEIPHPYLLRLAQKRFEAGEFDLSFWRYQLKENFQVVKWLPHIVHRVGHKDSFNFVIDGMNSDRYLDAKLVYDKFSGGCFPTWGVVYELSGYKKMDADVDQDTWNKFPGKLPTHEMLLDVSKNGGFRDLVCPRADAHFPFWNDPWPNVDGERLGSWWEREKDNANWLVPVTHFDIPPIMEYHLGKTTYKIRDELIEAIAADRTEVMIGL